LAIDPDYAHAHAWLGYAYAMLGFEEFGALPLEQAIPPARAAALRAVELDDTLPDAHMSRAIVATLYDWDWALAQREFDRGMALGSSGPAQHWYALYLCAMGHAEEAQQVISRAQVNDPLSVTIQVSVGRCLHYARRLDEAAQVFRAHLDLNPDSYQGYVALARNSVARGNLEEVVATTNQAIQNIGRRPILLAYAGEARQVGAPGGGQGPLAELREMGTSASCRRYSRPDSLRVRSLTRDSGFGSRPAINGRAGAYFFRPIPNGDWLRRREVQGLVKRVGVPG
jgi:tetratricopeptide (TPR) repeat protein